MKCTHTQMAIPLLYSYAGTQASGWLIPGKTKYSTAQVEL
jgi:hypothetical protein